MRDDIREAISFLAKEDVTLFNKAELARRYGCDPRTIDRYIKIQSGELVPKENSRKYKSKLDDYKGLITHKVDAYGCTAMAIYKLLLTKGYQGKYSIVADFVKQHKEVETKKATIRFETNPGLQAQVDWKEDMTLINRIGKIFKVNIFLLVMGFSRCKFLMITSDRSQETLFQCMAKAFEFFGGVPKEILFDNMKTVVDHAKSSFSKTVFNQRFEYFAKDIGFLPIAKTRDITQLLLPPRRKTYRVNRESMIKFEGRKYSVPIRYIGERMTANIDDCGILRIYYSNELVVSHEVSSKMYNYTIDTACEILKSDAMRSKTDSEILEFVQKNLVNMDKCIGGL